MHKEPSYIKLKSIGAEDIGFISVAEEHLNVPFTIKRVYWTYYTPLNIIRGGHAHKELEQVIFSLSGIIKFTTEDKHGNKKEFILNEPNKGVYLPKEIWRTIQFSENAVLLCIASELYDESDYIREYSEFKLLK